MNRPHTDFFTDSLLPSAASVLAGNTFIRSLFGAAFPLFARQMFTGLGIQWASTLLGCLALILVPIPILFWFYGHRLRQRSNFAPTAPLGPVIHRESVDDVSAGGAMQQMPVQDKQSSREEEDALGRGEKRSTEEKAMSDEGDLANLATVPRSTASLQPRV